MTRRYPPGPRDWLCGLSHMRRLSADILGFYADLARRYGDCVYLRLGPYRDYVFFHPDQVREVLVAKARYFRKMPALRRILAELDGNGLVFSEGDFWLRQRRLIQPAFHAQRFGRYAAVMVERTRRLLDRWEAAAGAAGTLEVDVEKEMTGLTLEIAARTFFDADVAGETAELGAAVATMSEVTVREVQSPLPLPDWLPLPLKRRKRRALDYLNGTVRRIIRERRASGEDRGDLLSMLLLAVDAEGDGGRMTDEQAREEAMTLFMAGHDTTAAGLTWAWYVLAKHPAVAGRAAAEVDAVLGGRPPTLEDVPRLRYLEWVLKETLRLYPPAIGVFTRQATEDVEIGGYPLRKGSLVQLLSYVTHRDPRWFPDPEAFDPERFAPGRVEQIPPYAYFPFGGGPRACIGTGFAMTEMALVVATLLQRLRVELAPGRRDVELLPHLSLRPKGGLPVRWTRRPTPAPARASV